MAEELSAEAKAICEQHYNFKSRSSCSPCPLISECHKPCQQLTQASLNEWRGRVNALAERHSLPPTENTDAQRSLIFL